MKVIKNICLLLVFVLFFIVLGIVGGNEQGEISDKDMFIWSSVLGAIAVVLAAIANKIEERDYLTEEEYEELLRKEGEK